MYYYMWWIVICTYSDWLIFIESRRSQQTDSPPESPHLLNKLFLHEIEAHGQQRHA